MQNQFNLEMIVKYDFKEESKALWKYIAQRKTINFSLTYYLSSCPLFDFMY